MELLPVSVIIPVHDAGDVLRRQLDALVSQVDAPAFEVIVVLNRCRDHSHDVAMSYRAALDIHVIKADQRPSAAYARNIGASSARGEFLLFCDADDVVGATWVARMVSPLASGAADLVGGRIDVDRWLLDDWIYEWRYAQFDGVCVQRQRPPRLDYVLGASLGCTRTSFDSIGGFDEQFAHAGMEEVDLAARLLRAGARIGAAPGASVLYSPRTDLRGVLRQARDYARGNALYEVKTGTQAPSGRRTTPVGGALRLTARLVLREHEVRPKVVVGRSLARYWALRERRRASRRPWAASSPPTTWDFVAPQAIPVVGGLALAARPVQARWYSDGGLERASLFAVAAILTSDSSFVDCGANVGVFSVAAALRVGPRGRVLAFEPDPRMLAVLSANLRRHRVEDVVEIKPVAVGACAGRLPYRRYENDLVSGFGRAPETFSPGRLLDEREVSVVALDQHADGRVDMVKIDVEGFESDVLAGSKQILVRNPDAVWIVELNPASTRAAGRSVDDLLAFFPVDRWSLWLIDELAGSGVQPIRPFLDAERKAAESAPASWYGNLLIAPRHRDEELRTVVSTINHEIGGGWV